VILAPGTDPKLLVPLALCLVACSGETAQDSVFTGRLEAADSVVGLVVSAQGHVDAYVCGGDTTFATHSRWFAGSLSSGTASLEAAGRRLDLTQQGETMDITLTMPEGDVYSTVAEQAAAGSRSALYGSATDGTCRWGVVVLDDGGAEPEVSGTWCDRIVSTTTDPAGESVEIFAQVTPVRPIDFSKPLLPVLVNTPSGEERFEVQRVSANNTP